MSVRVDPAAKRRPRSFGVSDVDSATIDSLAEQLDCSRSEVIHRAVRLLATIQGVQDDSLRR